MSALARAGIIAWRGRQGTAAPKVKFVVTMKDNSTAGRLLVSSGEFIEDFSPQTNALGGVNSHRFAVFGTRLVLYNGNNIKYTDDYGVSWPVAAWAWSGSGVPSAATGHGQVVFPHSDGSVSRSYDGATFDRVGVLGAGRVDLLGALSNSVVGDRWVACGASRVGHAAADLTGAADAVFNNSRAFRTMHSTGSRVWIGGKRDQYSSPAPGLWWTETGADLIDEFLPAGLGNQNVECIVGTDDHLILALTGGAILYKSGGVWIVSAFKFPVVPRGMVYAGGVLVIVGGMGASSEDAVIASGSTPDNLVIRKRFSMGFSGSIEAVAAVG